MPTTQKLNAELVRLLSAIFQRRYEPNFALGNAISLYLSLPGLRGLWPFSGINSVPGAINFAADGYNLSSNGTPEVWNTGLAPITVLDGLTTGDCWYYNDHAHFDILGTETIYNTNIRGLTCGAWVYPLDLSSVDRYIISKWEHTVAGNQSYRLYYSFANNYFEFNVRDSLSVLDTVGFGSSSSVNNWYFVAGRFDPGVDMTIWVNGESTSAATALTNVDNSTARFVVGAAHSLANREWDGYISFPFLTATALPDQWIFTLYQQTRALFGV